MSRICKLEAGGTQSRQGPGDRLKTALYAPPVEDPSQPHLTVGLIGGDIPIFPPLAIDFAESECFVCIHTNIFHHRHLLVITRGLSAVLTPTIGSSEYAS